MRILALAALLASFAPLAAQQRTWSIPPGGVAIYRADEELDPDPPGGVLPGCPLPHATILLQSELAAAGTHVAMDVQDWRWIAPHLAFDLRLRANGKITTKLTRVGGLGDLEVTGTGAAANGKETFDLAFKVVQPNFTADEKKAFGSDQRSWFGGEGSGKVTLARTFVDGTDNVRTFEATLVLNLVTGPLHGTIGLRGTFTQTWELREIQANRAEGFRTRVDQAIRDGADVIEHLLDPTQPGFATVVHPDDHPCGEGKLALAIQTLLAAGRTMDSPKVREAFAELHRRDIRETYSLSVALLATDAAHTPLGERDNLLRGAIQKPTPRQLGAEHAARVAEWSARLLENRDGSADRGYRSRWWYVPGNTFDNSNSHYALLGLWSASLCKQDVSPGVWFSAAEHWLAVQHPAIEKPRPLRLASMADLEKNGIVGTTRTAASRTVAPRGFSYRIPGDEPAYGSMTAAGLTALTLCRAALELGEKNNPALDTKIDDAIRANFAWLAANRSVRWNAGPPTHRQKWFFYWLYSLERACELSRTGLIDTWDWYHDGAQVLLALQDHDGRFGRAEFEEQCFAILFLKKAQLPVLTGPR